MKLTGLVFLGAAVSAQDDERKVPPRHPTQRLARLVEFTAEYIDQHWTDAGLSQKKQNRWKRHFETNAGRMLKNFERGQQRCGHYDENQLPHGGPPDRRRRAADDEAMEVDRYNREDPCVGTKQLTTGFRKWAERFLSQCSGQRQFNYQVNRMNDWNVKLKGFLQC